MGNEPTIQHLQRYQQPGRKSHQVMKTTHCLEI